MKTKSAIGQVEELAPRTLKEIVHGEAKTLRSEASVQEACDELRSEGITWSPVTDKNGQLLGTVSESELNRINGSSGRFVAASDLFADTLRVALSAAEETGGLVVPTAGAALEAAGYTRDFARTGLNRKTVYCFEDQTIAEAERLMRAGDLRRLPVLTHEKRMVGIVTLEDIVREQRATNS